MKVALVSSWDTKCGIAGYAANLVANCPGVDFFMLPPDKSILALSSAVCDILHLNYEAGLFRSFPLQDLSFARASNLKIVVTYHNSHRSWQRTSIPAFGLANQVVCHEPTGSADVLVIPHGIPEVRFDKPAFYYKRVGIVGFPFNWKGFHPAAVAAQANGLGIQAIMPHSDHVDTRPMEEVVNASNSDVSIITAWLPDDVVVKTLAMNLMNVFPYSGNATGISGAVRLGLAAKRPVILTRDRQFNDLFGYEDELYFVEGSLEAAVAKVQEDLENGNERIPNRLLQDMGWSKTGAMYRSMYEDLMRN